MIGRRLSYANVVATLALVFAMSGGALAAGHYIVSSTSQISPKVIKALKGKPGQTGSAGAAGAQGPGGPQGPAGPAGSQGAKGEPGTAGEKGETGATGATGGKGATGAQGPAGEPWTAGGVLPSGKTEKGEWAIIVPKEFAHPAHFAVASFTIPVAETLEFNTTVIGQEEGEGEPRENARVIKENEERKSKGEPLLPLPIPTACKGKVTEPGAQPGNLCVFVTSSDNLTVEGMEISLEEAGALGAVEPFENAKEERLEGQAFGTWAVTAK